MVVRKHEDHLEVELFSPKHTNPQMSFNSILADAGFTQQPLADQPAAQGSRLFFWKLRALKPQGKVAKRPQGQLIYGKEYREG